ncbi:MAG: hypothetical protein GY914_04260, partial [Prochlorococcus sp.]|nr:hypothetical protein [Prochlorococcus sp.]
MSQDIPSNRTKQHSKLASILERDLSIPSKHEKILSLSLIDLGTKPVKRSQTMNANKNANKSTHPDNQLMVSGHNGQRVGRERAKREGRKPGTWAPEHDEHGQPINRRRWTTALRSEALDQ